MEKPAVIAPASGPTIAARRDEVRRLFLENGRGSEDVARELRERGYPCSGRTVRNDAKALGISRSVGSVPWKHPAPGERVCAREGCEERFTPTGHQAAQPGGGRFHSRACARAASRVADPEERTCARKGCDEKFTPWPSEAVRPGHGQFCSYRCRQLHYWRDDREKVQGFLRSVAERYATPEGRAHLIKASARGLYARHGSTHAFGRHAVLFAAEKGKTVGRRSEAKAFADLIRDLRRQGWTQQAIADGTGLSRDIIGRFLRADHLR